MGLEVVGGGGGGGSPPYLGGIVEGINVGEGFDGGHIQCLEMAKGIMINEWLTKWVGGPL